MMSAHGFPFPDRPRGRGRRGRRSGPSSSRRAAGRCGARHVAGPRLVPDHAVHRRSGGADDPAPQLQSFAVRAAAGGLAAVVAVQARERTRGAGACAMVLGDPGGPGHPPAAGRLHRLRDAAAVAASRAAGDVVQRVHHRSAVHGVAARRLHRRVRAVRARRRAARAARGTGAEHRLPGLVAVGQVAGRARGRSRAGGHGPGRCAAILGADAAQYRAVAGGGDDARRVRGRLPLAVGGPRAHAVHRPSVQRAGVARSLRGPGRGAPAVVQPWLHARVRDRWRAGARRSADGRGAGLLLPLHRRPARRQRPVARDPAAPGTAAARCRRAVEFDLARNHPRRRRHCAAARGGCGQHGRSTALPTRLSANRDRRRPTRHSRTPAFRPPPAHRNTRGSRAAARRRFRRG